MVVCVFTGMTVGYLYYSRQLIAREKNYPIVELEALAVLATVEQFRFYLSGDHSLFTQIILRWSTYGMARRHLQS